MSDTEIVKGSARCMSLLEMTEEFPAYIMKLYPGREFRGELLEYLEDRNLYDSYHVREDRVYRVDTEIKRPADFFAENTGSKDGTIHFHYMYYNGSCHWGELLNEYIDGQD